jgi:hypothetical protein
MTADVRLSVASLPRLPLASAAPLLRAVREWARHPLRGAPLTAATLLALAVTSASLAGARGPVAHLLALRASTNLHNLSVIPIEVLVVSVFWVSAPWVFWPVAAVLLPVLGAAERRLGSWRAALVFVGGHLGATLVTVAVIAAGVAGGWLPRSLTYAVDVGPSYGLAAVAAALILAVRAPRRRRALAAALVGVLVAVLALDRTFTDAGHLVAALIGFALAGLALAATNRTTDKVRSRPARPG